MANRMIRVFCEEGGASSMVPEDYMKPRGGAAVAAERAAAEAAALTAAQSTEPDESEPDERPTL